jgi:1,4-dihydroxy-2-naphthoate octaprenyltransferase
MRYRIGEDGALTPVDASGDLITATVIFTLFIGIVFLLAGLRGRQSWLQFWGGLTCLCCGAYFMRGWLR